MVKDVEFGIKLKTPPSKYIEDNQVRKLMISSITVHKQK